MSEKGREMEKGGSEGGSWSLLAHLRTQEKRRRLTKKCKEMCLVSDNSYSTSTSSRKEAQARSGLKKIKETERGQRERRRDERKWKG